MLTVVMLSVVMPSGLAPSDPVRILCVDFLQFLSCVHTVHKNRTNLIASCDKQIYLILILKLNNLVLI